MKETFMECPYMANTEDAPYFEGVLYSSGCRLKSETVTCSCWVNRKRGICPNGYNGLNGERVL